MTSHELEIGLSNKVEETIGTLEVENEKSGGDPKTSQSYRGTNDIEQRTRDCSGKTQQNRRDQQHSRGDCLRPEIRSNLPTPRCGVGHVIDFTGQRTGKIVYVSAWVPSRRSEAK